MGSVENYQKLDDLLNAQRQNICMGRSCLKFLNDQNKDDTQLRRRKSSLDRNVARITMMSDSSKNRLFHRDNIELTHQKLCRSQSEPVIMNIMEGEKEKQGVKNDTPLDEKILQIPRRAKLCKKPSLDLNKIDEITHNNHLITNNDHLNGRQIHHNKNIKELYCYQKGSSDIVSKSPDEVNNLYFIDEKNDTFTKEFKKELNNQKKQPKTRRQHTPLSRTVSLDRY